MKKNHIAKANKLHKKNGLISPAFSQFHHQKQQLSDSNQHIL